MVTTDKVQTGNSTTGTSTSTTWRCPYTQPKVEQGWECPRCGRINAPWVRQCDCSRNNWNITCDDTTAGDEWWKKYVTSTDTFRIHPDDITYTTAHNPSDSWSSNANSYKTYATDTIHDGKLKYKEK